MIIKSSNSFQYLIVFEKIKEEEETKSSKQNFYFFFYS